MSATVLTDVGLLVGGFEMTPFSGSFAVEEMAAMKEANNFAARGYEVVLPGVFSATASIGGHADYATGGVSATFNSASKGSQQLLGIIPTGSAQAAGDYCTFMRGRLDTMKMVTGAVGEVADFSMSLTSDEAAVEGYVLAPWATRAGGLTGTAVQIPGGVAAGERLVCGLHVATTTGTNLAVVVQSDTTGFPSPTTVATFSTVSATGWQFISVNGPIADDFFRVSVTIGTNSFTYAVVVGTI